MRKFATIFILLGLVEVAFSKPSCSDIRRKYRCSGGATYPIHLTFDDGPVTGLTEKVLKALEKHQVPATFFVVGDRITPGAKHYSDDHIRTLRKVIDSGHLIGSHGFHHEHHSKIDNISELREKIRKAKKSGIGAKVDGIVQLSFLTEPLLFRLPYGDGWHPLTTNQDNKKQVMEILTSEGFSHIGWPNNGGSRGLHITDWKHGLDYQDLLLRRICEFKGGVVLMHDNQAHTAKGIDQWIEAVKCLGHPIVGLEPFFKNEKGVVICEGAKALSPPKAPKEVGDLMELINSLGECPLTDEDDSIRDKDCEVEN